MQSDVHINVLVLEICAACDGGAGDDALCATLCAGGCGGYALFTELLEMLEVMRRVLRMLEAVEGGLCLLEAL